MTFKGDPRIGWDSNLASAISDVIIGEQLDPDLQINRNLRDLLKHYDRYFMKHDPKYYSVFRKD